MESAVVVAGRQTADEQPVRWQKFVVVGLSLVVVVSLVALVLPAEDRQFPSSAARVTSASSQSADNGPRLWQCADPCSLQIVESIPEGLMFNTTSDTMHLPTYKAWLRLLAAAESKLELASSYWTLRGKDVFEDPTAWQGEDIYDRLVKATKKGITIDIAQNKQPNSDTDDLAKIEGVRVRNLDFPALVGAGILHTKLWLVDRKHFYVGSANFDWRSLTQVKEMGVLAMDCPCLAEDMGKIFDVYWRLGAANARVPSEWPSELTTAVNARSPLRIDNDADNSSLRAFLASSPPPFCPTGRELDVDAVLKTIDAAEKFVYVAVMDYFPQTIYTPEPVFWPRIDDRLRRAAIERGVEVRLLLSDWADTRPAMKNFLRSLTALDGISRGRHGKRSVRVAGKLFKVPAFTPAQEAIPFARVNHNKYMVTDKTAYIGTSNWSADYFISTGGIGFVVSPEDRGGVSNGTDLRKQLKDVFLRDWTSVYAHELA